MQATPECWKCLFTSEADQREKITASASHSHPCQLSSASLTPCRASGPTFPSLPLSSWRRLRCHKRFQGQGRAPLKPTHTSHRPWRKQARRPVAGTKSLSGGVSCCQQNHWLWEVQQITALEETCPQAGTEGDFGDPLLRPVV